MISMKATATKAMNVLVLFSVMVTLLYIGMSTARLQIYRNS